MAISNGPRGGLGANALPLPALEAYSANRSACLRLDKEGLLGGIADKIPKRALAMHFRNAVKEAGELLEEIDQLILAPAGVA